MKRIFCVLIVMVLIMSAAASAELHMEVQCTFMGSMEGTTVYLDQYEQDGRVFTVSSLFPDKAVKSAYGTGILSELQALNYLRSEMIAEIVNTADRYIMPWIESHFNTPVRGQYAGELFEKASLLQECAFPMSELTDYLKQHQEEKSADNGGFRFFLLLDSMVSSVSGNAEQTIHVRSYDEGKYITFMFMIQGKTIMTLSADLASGGKRKWLIGYRDDGLYCFRKVSISYEPGKSIIETTMLVGTEPSSLNASTKELYSDKLMLNDGPDAKSTLAYTLKPVNVSRPLVISGSSESTDDGSGFLYAVIGIDGLADEGISVNVRFEKLNRPVSFSDQSMVHSDNEKESAEILTTAVSNMALLAAEILPVLPGGYQNILLKLFYP